MTLLESISWRIAIVFVSVVGCIVLLCIGIALPLVGLIMALTCKNSYIEEKLNKKSVVITGEFVD